MKTNKLIIATAWIAIAGLIWSCDTPGDVTPQTPEENFISDNILVGSNSAISRVRGTGFGGPLGAIYGNLSSTAGRSLGSPLSLQRSIAGRSETDEEETPSCLTETYEDDGAGNYTFTIDFGDGCEYYGEFMKGKMVEKGTYTDNNFTSEVVYTNFGGEDWSINGTHSYSGTWSSIDDAGEEVDSLYMFDASYEFAANLQMEYTEYGYHDSTEVSTGEQIIKVNYVADGSETADENGYTVQTRNESVEVSTGESFDSKVDSPLFYNNACGEEDVWIFVSGVESGSYTYGDESGTYSIDYGDGTCDNIITVTENGVSEEIDLGDEWDDWEEECEDHEDDATDD